MDGSTAQLVVLAAVFVAVAVLAIRFVRLCLDDLAHTNDAQLNILTRRGWVLVIAIVIPVGGLVYLARGRTR